MKTIILTVLLSASAIVFAGCQTATNTNSKNTAAQNSNTNSAMSMNGMNHNQMMNGNSMNHNGMMMNGNSNMSGMMDMKSSPNAAAQPYDLPVGKDVIVSITPTEAGNISFTCGMGMMKGSLVVSD